MLERVKDAMVEARITRRSRIAVTASLGAALAAPAAGEGLAMLATWGECR